MNMFSDACTYIHIKIARHGGTHLNPSTCGQAQGQAGLARLVSKDRKKGKEQMTWHRGVMWCRQGTAKKATGPMQSQESDDAQGCSPCTMMKAVAWMLSTLLDAKHVYSPLSLWATFCIYRPPEGVVFTRGSIGKGVRSPLVQVI